ncbi:MAG TPA: 2-keto-3-deoxygluconate permease [Clostridia bacterium]|nr:2-keto-3-deoxygluconate permease [Clostridia bacterium]
MLKFMRKIPGGLLIIPMLLSALVNTIAPGFFGQFGGLTEALFTTKGINYIVAMVCFCSANLLDVRSIGKVLKKQGTILLVKVLLCLVFSYIFMQLFSLQGVAGVSAIAFVVAICSVNPSLYLALVSDYGEELDKAAFGLTGLICVPAFPIFVFSITQGGGIDWTPILSTLIPITAGFMVGNLDKELAKMFSSLLVPLTPFMGVAFGAGINIIDSLKAGPQGILITILFYLLLFPIMFTVETKLLKYDGIATLGMSSIAGMSIAVPSILAFSNTDYLAIAPTATAQIAFGVLLTSAITPLITQWYAKKNAILKNI